MPVITSHQPGMVCWTDLSTTDVAGAKRFYNGLFGWNTVDQPIPDDGVYVMASLGGQPVAAMSQIDEESKRQGVPPHWNTYFAVARVDEIAARVVPAGGKLVDPPFDVMDVGRMCVAQDPSGAVFCLWEAKKHIGAGRMGEHGTLAWAELMTRDPEACRDFYRQLFGFTAQPMKTPRGEYTVFNVGGKGSCGMMPMSPQAPKETPSYWTVYFAANDCDVVAQAAQRLGGKLHVMPTDIPDVGRFAVLNDPQGAFFAIIQPKPM